LAAFFEEQMLHVDALLGSGSFGQVYRATDDSGHAVAVKRSSLFESDGDLVVGTLREYMTHNSMTPHPSLCMATRMWTSRHAAFFVLPLFHGNLLEFAKRMMFQLKFQDFCVVAHTLASAVSHMHAQGWMHRDIKPENMYVDGHGGMALGDFNLARFCDSTSDVARTTRGSSTTHICTLWTRAPELCVADLEGRAVLDTGFEVDAFSVGATLLAVAAGGYVFGKRIASESANETESYLHGFFSVAGTDSLIRAGFPTLDHDTLPSSNDFAKRLMTLLPPGWTESEQMSVSVRLARLLDPLPSRRASVQCLMDLPKAAASSDFQCMTRIPRKVASFIIKPHETAAQPASCLTKPDSLWSQLGNWRVPIPLAMHAVLLRRTSMDPTKTFLYLLRAIHRFSFVESTSTQRESVVQVLPSIRMNPRLWCLARQVEGQPFLVCCLAAWIHVHGEPPESIDVLSSDAMQRVLQHAEADGFFGAFGLQWKSQRSMLESWRRL
jgi:serine/threonine protein kinase